MNLRFIGYTLSLKTFGDKSLDGVFMFILFLRSYGKFAFIPTITQLTSFINTVLVCVKIQSDFAVE